MLKKLKNLFKKKNKTNPNKTNAPQQIDPKSLAEEKKTSDLEVLISGRERAQVREKTHSQMDNQNGKKQQTQNPDRSSLLQKLPNPFRDPIE